jgi:hypothetical protein
MTDQPSKKKFLLVSAINTAQPLVGLQKPSSTEVEIDTEKLKKI